MGRAPAKGTHHEYVGRSGAANRAGVRVAPRLARVVYEWERDAAERHDP